MKLRLVNKTAYRAADLRKFFLAGLRAMGAVQPKRVEVYYRSGNRHICWGAMGQYKRVIAFDPSDRVTAVTKFNLREGAWIKMLTDKPPVVVDMAKFARVFEHEVLHTRGVEHREMTAAQKACDQPLPKWAEGLVLRVKEPKAKLTPAERSAIREGKARAMLDLYEGKQRRVAKLVKKWRAKVRYYERKAIFAAAKREREA